MITFALFLTFVVTTAPYFQLRNSKDEKTKPANYLNKVLVLTFSNRRTANLATVWSVPLYYKYKDRDDVVFLWVSDMRGIPKFVFMIYRKTLNESAEKLGIPYPLLDWGGKVSKTYGMSNQWPLLVLIGKDGNIKWRHVIRNPVESTTELESLLEAELH